MPGMGLSFYKFFNDINDFFKWNKSYHSQFHSKEYENSQVETLW